MGLKDAFRRAEQRGKKVARRGMEQAMVSIDDAERAVRRRMRIYPHHVANDKAIKDESDARRADIPAEDSEIEGRKIA
jgi:hypothetical protein